MWCRKDASANACSSPQNDAQRAFLPEVGEAGVSSDDSHIAGDAIAGHFVVIEGVPHKGSWLVPGGDRCQYQALFILSESACCLEQQFSRGQT